MNMLSDNLMVPRITQLLENMKRRHLECADSCVWTDEYQSEFNRLATEAYIRSSGDAEVLRKSDFLMHFARNIPINIVEGELIVGSQLFRTSGLNKLDADTLSRMGGNHGNHGHIVVDYGMLVENGIAGLRKMLPDMPMDSGEQRINREAFGQTLDAFEIFIQRHGDVAALTADAETDDLRKSELLKIADNCRQLVKTKPESFMQGVQLVWFAQIFLHAEGGGAAVSFGRFDQYLWPLLEKDILAGKLDLAAAGEILACFFIKTCEGDESQNLIVGGIDSDGNMAENPLSLLVLEASAATKVFQPSISVRITPQSSDEFWEKAVDLVLAGTGMPSFFNDKVVIDALKHQGLPVERAADWAIVGCYEATTQGDTFGMTVAGHLSLPLLIHEFLDDQIAVGTAESFDDMLEQFKAFAADFISRQAIEWQERRDDIFENVASPFQSICLGGCLRSGLLAEQGGGMFNYFGVNILGIGTLIDSLCVIKELVYDKPEFSLEYINYQLKENFVDESLRQKCRNLCGRYGTDNEFTNMLTDDISNFIADTINDMTLSDGQRFSPGFFWFGGDIMGDHPATPDGRRDGERVSYGAGPGEFSVGMTPTSILRSTANIAHGKCACGNPVLLSFARSDVSDDIGRERLREVIEAYFSLGGSHLHINLLSADDLKAAQENPENWAGLTVRISGFSAKFITLHKKWQDAIIARTRQGL